MSRYRDSGSTDCKVYVGDLGSNFGKARGSGASKQELEDAFSYYGPLRSVWVARNPPGFAFVEFEDRRDAEDAVKGLDGRTVCGRRVRVEISAGKRRNNQRGPRGPRWGGGPENRCYDCGGRGHYARDCPRLSRRRKRSRSRSRSRSHSRDRRSQSRSKSQSPVTRSRSRSVSPRRSKTKSRSRSPSRS